jgi:hypothetical protein
MPVVRPPGGWAALGFPELDRRAVVVDVAPRCCRVREPEDAPAAGVAGSSQSMLCSATRLVAGVRVTPVSAMNVDVP